MIDRRRLTRAGATAATVVAAMGVSALPSAQADGPIGNGHAPASGLPSTSTSASDGRRSPNGATGPSSPFTGTVMSSSSTTNTGSMTSSGAGATTLSSSTAGTSSTGGQSTAGTSAASGSSAPGSTTGGPPTTGSPTAGGSATTGSSTTGSSTAGSSTTSSSTTSSSTTGSSTTGSSTSGTPVPAAPVPSGPGWSEPRSSQPQPGQPIARRSHGRGREHTAAPGRKLPSGKGVPSSRNPGYSLALPGPAAVGVPNFFIDAFRIPPFLIPIYQAAGIEYDVPWQVLAAINEVETDYGRNLSISSAGAVGWMQFLPSTWRQWAVDATGSGMADPYNPVDAIFTAARYLQAAGASTNLARAIFAYNHADWYVQSVLLRARLIAGIPSQLIGALTGLVEGHFPVAAPAEYAEESVVALAGRRIRRANPAITVDSTPGARGTAIFARRGSPVIAVNDGRIIRLGESPALGRYIVLQDATGNVYTYAHLGSIPRLYPVPKPVSSRALRLTKQFTIPAETAPTAPATAGTQPPAPTAAGTRTTTSTAVGRTTTSTAAGTRTTAPTAVDTRRTTSTAAGRTTSTGTLHPASAGTQAGASSAAGPTATISTPLAKERLFAHPDRPASYASGGDLQISGATARISSFRPYFSDALHLARDQYTLRPLRVGSIVVAGTIIGRIGGPSQGAASHLWFMIQPAGASAPYIDPKPILDGWRLLGATAVYRAESIDPFTGPATRNPTIGQMLLMSKQQLTELVLHDPHIGIYACGRRDIQAGLIDRRVLATIEFLSASGLDPYVSGLDCGHTATGSSGVDAAGATGASVDISMINGIPVLGHQGPGSITDMAIRRLLTLQGAMAPDEIVSDMSYRGQPTTLALPSHRNRIQIVFTPAYGTSPRVASQMRGILSPGQWQQLIARIGRIPEPVLPIAPSRYAIKVAR